MNQDRSLTVVESAWLKDWYIIKWNSLFGFVSDADPEGTAEEMISIADAIESRGSAQFRRVAIATLGDKVEIWSPRNSTREESVSLEAADVLARKIREVCAKPSASP